MTKPTQAQIDAAIVAFCKSAGVRIEPYSTEGSQFRRDLTAALTAAAEVGEGAKIIFDPLAVSATIERCAQELGKLEQHTFGENDQYAFGVNNTIKLGQAAIRKLKDEA